MASGPSIDDNISLLLNPSTPGQTDSSGNPLERPGSASLDDGDPSKKSQSPAIMMRSTKVETLTPREMEVLALAWDNMKDSRVSMSNRLDLDCCPKCLVTFSTIG